MIVAIISAVLSFIPAIIVGKHVTVGLGFLCYFISLIAGILGFYIGKFLNEFVGDRFIISNGGFLDLVIEKFNALYGPQIVGFLLGLILPIVLCINIQNNKGNKISEKAMSDNTGISKTAKEYVMPLISEDEEVFSAFGNIINRSEKTENEVIYVNWELENNDYIHKLNSDIISELIPESKDIMEILEVDAKKFVPMDEYRKFNYEDYDESLNDYIENEVYREIIRYIKYGNRRESIYSDSVPYNADVANWCKYFDFGLEPTNHGPDKVYLVEKSDYTHWYFDNGKSGSEDDYNEFKNKYILSQWGDGCITDAVTDKFRREHNGLFPGFESKIILSDIKAFDYRIEDLKSDGHYLSYSDLFFKDYGEYPYILNLAKSYDEDFLSFVEANWNEYPDTMKLHLNAEKIFTGDFKDYILSKVKKYNEYKDDNRNYLIINCYEIEKNEYNEYIGDPLFVESADAFRKIHDLSDYSEPQKALLLKAYYASDEYKDRLNLFKQLVRFDNAKITANVEYKLYGRSDTVEAYRNNTNTPIVLQYEIATIEGWKTKDIPLAIKDGKISFDSRLY